MKHLYGGKNGITQQNAPGNIMIGIIKIYLRIYPRGQF
jgi:hypothetical protein